MRLAQPQTPTRTNDLLNAVRFAALPAVAAAGDGSAPAPALPQTPGPAGPPMPFLVALVGDEYYTAKEQLILDEQARYPSAV